MLRARMPAHEGGGLRERSAELARLSEGMQAARAGRGGAVVLEGPAGIGKTSLLEAGRALATDAGLRVLSARAGQLERDLGWNLVRQLFAGVIAAAESEQHRLLRGASALAAPALGLAPAETAEAGSLHGLYWLVSELAEEGPLAVFVDDAHWGDLSSLLFLSYLAERVRDLPILVVATVRRGEQLPGPLAVLGARPGTEVLALRELSPAASSAVTRETLGAAAADAFCDACHQSTGGNPFLLLELLAQLRLDGVPPTAERAAEVSRVTPATVSRTVLVRLARLTPEAQDLAGAVAVLAEGSLAEAAALARVDDDVAAAACDSLSDADILAAGLPLAFAHPVIREVIYAELPSARRERMHAAAAAMLSDRGEERRAAAQLLETEPRGDAWVVQVLRVAAATAAAEGAPAVAASLLRRATAEPPPAPERADVLVALGRTEAATGEPGATNRLSAALEVCSEPRGRAQIQLERGRLLYLAGEPGASAQAFDDGLAELDHAAQPDASLSAQLRAGWLTAARLEVPLRARAAQLTYELAADPPAGDNYGERALLAHIAGQLTFDAAPREQALALTRRALADGGLLRDETSDGMAWISAMGALGWGDYFDEYEQLMAAALEDSRRRGSVLGFATAAYGYSFSHFYRGMLSDAVADAEQAIAAERDGWRHFLSPARGQLAWALIERGEYDAAAGQLALARADHQTSAQALVLESLSRLQLVRGEHRGALDTAMQAGRVATEAGIPNPSIFAWRSRAAVAAGALGERERAEQLLEEELTLARGYGAPRPIGIALTSLGVVRGTDGIAPLEEAVATLESSPAGLEHARALIMLGAALRRKGLRGAARDRLVAGLQAAESLGATRLQERARVELTAAGLRAPRRRAGDADVLTPAELRVAEAAAEGMSNREIAQALFVSLRTVETHLTHVYQKLGIPGRDALADGLSGR